MPESGPTVLRRQLGRRLKRARETAGVTGEQVEAEGFASRTKLWRIEAGRVPVKRSDLQALCRLYGLGEEETAVLEKLAANADQQGWWEDYDDVVPSWFEMYVGLEAAAQLIQGLDEGVVPGEVQTADYAKAIYQAAQPSDGRAEIERHVKLRMDRQAALLGRGARLQMVVGEGALRRPVGGPDVMAAQIQHLRELSNREHVEIRWLPFSVGAHAAMAGAFRILTFDDPEDPDVVYLEEHTGARYLEKEAELAEYRRIYDLIIDKSEPIKEYLP
ncbi:helix-turn-helix domain-containing protein [Actinoplanes sp. URMC 104]|uniref:helix-turn-helix domain-containing protein n=1 Tax=Actinoplanes sp. URMC 104 TaxID=3423409 RepID=UPI003F1B2B28